MKIYLVCLALMTSSIAVAMPTKLVTAEPNPNAQQEATTAKIISPAAALERLIVAKKLEASWFAPAMLKAADINKIQLQRDESLKLGTMKYGNYKSVVAIGGDKYRIIFDGAEPDAVIAQFYLDKSGRIAGISLTEKPETLPKNPQAQANTKTFPVLRCFNRLKKS